jgi:hypothetical protein
MATYNKFNQFTKDLIDGVHDFDAHTFKVMLTLTAPVASNSVKADLTEISAGNGYTAGGSTTTISTSTSSGTAKATASDVTFTASGGAIANFRYVVVYNDSPTSPADPLICWVDYGSTVTLNSGDSLLVDFNGTTGLFTVA